MSHELATDSSEYRTAAYLDWPVDIDEVEDRLLDLSQ